MANMRGAWLASPSLRTMFLGRSILSTAGKMVAVRYATTKATSSGKTHQDTLDPIQKLFIDKIHEYAAKGRGLEPEFVNVLNSEKEKLAVIYGDGYGDAKTLPQFEFREPSFSDSNPTWEMSDKFDRPKLTES